ncbi:PIG-L family deacetylase [Robiginitalea sp. IMCC43444]|uniref:PIG-L family deacetylase n=1 Tax=Robiginitalea sp. IMCC43444 TaxID=3459121 RepID=UPI004041AF01
MPYFARCILLWVLVFTSFTNAQAPHPPSSVQLYNDLQKLNFLGNALYVAAHPDDENTRLISYLSNAVHARTAYLSLTRGDGGQNLIGPELRELLGVLRTQELLAARSVDGGEQFFTRANDFGYSKHPDETLSIWEKDKVLSDVVRIIRQFRPDVIINRFDHRTPGSTHGHHTSSAILSTEAFELAGDSNAYPEQLQELQPWSPSRLFFNTSWWFYGSQENFEKADKSRLLSMDVGVYYPERGLSNNEIASIASSQHLCQGFGRPTVRGSQSEYIELLRGEMPEGQDLFEGVDTSWNRIEGGSAIGKLLSEVEQNFNFTRPSVHLPVLLQAYQKLQELKPSYWKTVKSEELSELIAGIIGLYMEASADAYYGIPGSDAPAELELTNRSDWPVRLTAVTINGAGILKEPLSLKANEANEIAFDFNIPKNHPGTSPYWLRQNGSLGMYAVSDPELIGKPETPAAFSLKIILEINGIPITFVRPVIHRYAEPDKGELFRAFEILPPATVSFQEKVKIFSGAHPQQVQLTVKAMAPNTCGSLSLSVPAGWNTEPKTQEFIAQEAGEERVFQFTLIPPDKSSEGYVEPRLTLDGKVYTKELITIAYDHIPTQSVLLPAQLKVVRLNVEKAGQHVGYVMGAGDAIPENLEAIGYTVHLLKPSELTKEQLRNMDALVLGIRAYNVLDELPFKQDILMEYVKEGGTMIVQYNTSGRGNADFSANAPYPLRLSRDRVSDETARVSILHPDHPLMNFPNQIREEDFNNWVQERGLYFPNQWDAAYTPLLAMNDPGESAKKGSLLVAPYGEGYYIYTGLSFFRELPAGVPGAFKLFSNMLSIGKAQIKSEGAVKG